MWFQAKLLSFYSNLCRTYEISQNPPWVETQKIPFSISALAESGFVLYSSSPFQRRAQLFLEPNTRREVTSWLGWPYGSPVATNYFFFSMNWTWSTRGADCLSQWEIWTCWVRITPVCVDPSHRGQLLSRNGGKVFWGSRPAFVMLQSQ